MREEDRRIEKGRQNRKVVLVERPQGKPREESFALKEGLLREPREGEVVLKNRYLSLDPAIRGWMREGASYMEPIPIGGVVRSGVVGEVIESRARGYRQGEILVALGGWERFSVIRASQIARRVTDPERFPLSNQLSVLGGNGLTAYFGMYDIGKPKAGETVLVSAAAGGVGSIAGQLAKRAGCRVIGVAGGEEKCKWVKEALGFDGAIDYKSSEMTVLEGIKRECPDGVDVYFDNVGGEILNAALMRINVGARVVLCGAIAQINDVELPPGPSQYIRLLTQRAQMRGFVTMDYAARWQEGSAALSQWLMEGSLKHREHIIEGLENAPAAFLGLFEGVNLGKMMVKV